MSVKNRLREIRHELMLDSQTEFAELLKIQKNQYNRYERNEVQPSLKIALEIAKKLGKSTDEIFYLSEEPLGD